jgi:hypothetical protein
VEEIGAQPVSLRTILRVGITQKQHGDSTGLLDVLGLDPTPKRPTSNSQGGHIGHGSWEVSF